jgi:SapC
VFTTGDGGKTYAAVAVLGLAAGENLFYAEGRWTSGAYIPAYARRYPFCMARVNLNKVEQKDRLICVEKSSLDEERGEAMFDAQGQASDKWKGVERLLSEYEADLERMREMCALLADYGLLESFSMQATLKKEKGGGSMQMGGMHRVAEKKLEDLNAAQLKNLIRKGYLARLYVHLLSLENFARLLERKGERLQA